MRLKSFVCAVGLAASVVFFRQFLLKTQFVRARLYVPSGPIADRLSAIELAPRETLETDALSDLFVRGAIIRFGGKGPSNKLRLALLAAKFDCFTFWHNQTQHGLRVCRNDAAGITREGCIRDWLVLIDLAPGERRRTRVERVRTFVSTSC